MLNKNIINNLKYLPLSDKLYLLSQEKNTNLSWSEICKNLSIFSEKVIYDSFNEYEYLETFNNIDIFYISIHKIFIDNDKKILLY